MADNEDEDEMKIETEPEDSDFAEEHGGSATCMVQRLLCNQKSPRHYTMPLNLLFKVFG